MPTTNDRISLVNDTEDVTAVKAPPPGLIRESKMVPAVDPLPRRRRGRRRSADAGAGRRAREARRRSRPPNPVRDRAARPPRRVAREVAAGREADRAPRATAHRSRSPAKPLDAKTAAANAATTMAAVASTSGPAAKPRLTGKTLAPPPLVAPAGLDPHAGVAGGQAGDPRTDAGRRACPRSAAAPSPSSAPPPYRRAPLARQRGARSPRRQARDRKAAEIPGPTPPAGLPALGSGALSLCARRPRSRRASRTRASAGRRRPRAARQARSSISCRWRRTRARLLDPEPRRLGKPILGAAIARRALRRAGGGAARRRRRDRLEAVVVGAHGPHRDLDDAVGRDRHARRRSGAASRAGGVREAAGPLHDLGRARRLPARRSHGRSARGTGGGAVDRARAGHARSEAGDRARADRRPLWRPGSARPAAPTAAGARPAMSQLDGAPGCGVHGARQRTRDGAGQRHAIRRGRPTGDGGDDSRRTGGCRRRRAPSRRRRCRAPRPRANRRAASPAVPASATAPARRPRRSRRAARRPLRSPARARSRAASPRRCSRSTRTPTSIASKLPPSLARAEMKLSAVVKMCVSRRGQGRRRQAAEVGRPGDRRADPRRARQVALQARWWSTGARCRSATCCSTRSRRPESRSAAKNITPTPRSASMSAAKRGAPKIDCTARISRTARASRT